MYLLPTDKPMVPNSQKQSQRIPWGSMPEDITCPSSSRRPREMMLLPLILWKGRNRNKSSSQLNHRHLMKLYTLMAHPHTQFLHTAVSITNMGYPWLAHPSVIYSTTLRRSMKWTTGIQITNTGYPWLALLLILHITVPTLDLRTPLTKMPMVNVGYPRFAIQPIISMLPPFILPVMTSIENHSLFHTATLMTIQCLWTLPQLCKLQHLNPLMLYTPLRVQKVMTRKSIADLLIQRNPQSQVILYFRQLTSFLKAPVIALVSPLHKVGMPSTASR